MRKEKAATCESAQSILDRLLGATFNPATIHEMAVYSPVCVFFFCSLVATENFAIA